VTRLSDERMCAGREFQLLGADTQKAREAKDDLTQEGTARRWQLVDGKHLEARKGLLHLLTQTSWTTTKVIWQKTQLVWQVLHTQLYSSGGSIGRMVWPQLAIACFGWGFNPKSRLPLGARNPI